MKRACKRMDNHRERMDYHHHHRGGGGRRHERGSNWSDPEIVELLSLWSDEAVQLELESSLRNQHVFDRLASALRERGIYRTGDQCREKIKKMKLEYRRIKDNHKLRSWKFYDVMDRVLANRPVLSYSALGGAVLAHQHGLRSPAGGMDAYANPAHPLGLPLAAAFGPAASGGFLFGHPPRMYDDEEDTLRVKCEDVETSGDDGMLSGDGPAVPPELLYGYGSGGDDDTDGRSLNEEPVVPVPVPVRRGESATNISPSSGPSEHNMPGSSSAPEPPPPPPRAPVPNPNPGSAPNNPAPNPGSASNPAPNPRSQQPAPSERQRKRRRGAAGGGCRGAGGCHGGALDQALVGFLSWQRAAEERLLSLEEARQEREARSEERRELREERRGEQERRHELRLLGAFAGALAAAKQTNAAVSDPPTAPQRPTTPPPPTAAAASSPPATPRPRPPGHPPPETPASSLSSFLSRRGNAIRLHRGILQEGYARYHADRHHDRDNPGGIINMGTSENKLCFDLLLKRMSQPDMQHSDPALLQYPDWKGHAFLREAVARFLSHYCRSRHPLKASNVVVMNGCGSLFSAIAAVICDPGDAILIPAPFYGVITEDVQLYSGVRLFHVPLDCEPSGSDGRPFHLTVASLEDALTNAKREGVNIRAVILVNPHNPLAEVYTPQEMTDFLDFAKRNRLHAIVDEVYMLTVFDQTVTFHSVLSLDRLPDPQRTHVLWGISKDFAMAGVRVGTLYTENQDLVEALDQLGGFHGVPGPTQHRMAQLLQDRDWISGEFLPENRRRMRAAHSFLTDELRRLDVPYLHRPAGFYVWADLRKYLSEASFGAELALWRCFLRHKVVVSCGQAFSCSSPGWFRLVFTLPQRPLLLGVQRIRQALEEWKVTAGSREVNQTRPAGEEEEEEDEKEEEQSTQTSQTENKAATDNAVPSPPPSPSPGNQSAEEASPSSTGSQSAEGSAKEKDSPPAPAPAVSPLAEPGDDPATPAQAPPQTSSRPADTLDSLIGALRRQIRSSDWLERNTPELSAGEDPATLDVFTELLDRARK